MLAKRLFIPPDVEPLSLAVKAWEQQKNCSCFWGGAKGGVEGIGGVCREQPVGHGGLRFEQLFSRDQYLCGVAVYSGSLEEWAQVHLRG